MAGHLKDADEALMTRSRPQAIGSDQNSKESAGQNGE
jgi:hypothetical protein